jgi:hypothetical protein
VSALEPWQGPIILALSAGHGVHTGDLPAIPLVVAAIARWRGSAPPDAHPPRHARRCADPASAVLLGVLLLLAGVNLKGRGGALVPAGGATINGAIVETAAQDPVAVDRWSEVAATYDGATVRLYVNGECLASQAATGPIQATCSPLWIGGNLPYGEHFRGRIDEIRVYSRALRPRELRADMATAIKPAPGLVAAYAFDAGSGTTAADSSGEANAGVIRRAK